MKRRGDISISFGIIFSIIIIIAIIGVGFYMIRYFLSLKDCTELGLFKRDLQTRIDDAWNSEEVKNSFTGSVPSSVDEICIGDLEDARGTEKYFTLSRFDEPGANLFYYPLPSGKCEITYGKLTHARFNGFTCIKAIRGSVTVALEKRGFDSLVSVCDPAATTCAV